MMPNILQRSIIHLYPLECNEEKQLNEIPSKINSKANRKGEELKNDELKTEMNQGDKAKHHPKKAATVEAREGSTPHAEGDFTRLGTFNII